MRLIVTQGAILNFERIIEYLLFKAGENIAQRISDEIWDAVDFIVANPYAGQQEPYLAFYGLNHQRWIVGHYKIVYKIEGETIYVTDIFDTRQDPKKILP